MTKEEIVRRLRAILSFPRGKRVMSVDAMCLYLGITKEAKTIYDIANRGKMSEINRKKLSKLLTLIENDQIKVIRGNRRIGEKDKIEISDNPRPPQKIINTLEITKDGPKLRFMAQNPNSFPNFKEVNTHIDNNSIKR